MYHVEVVNNGDSKFNVKSADYELIVDTKGAGITPPDALLASLGSCIGVYIRKYVEGAKLAIGEFKINVSGELSREAPVSFKHIDVSVELKDAKLDERRIRALTEFIKNCPVHNTLESAPVVDIKVS